MVRLEPTGTWMVPVAVFADTVRLKTRVELMSGAVTSTTTPVIAVVWRLIRTLISAVVETGTSTGLPLEQDAARTHRSAKASLRAVRIGELKPELEMAPTFTVGTGSRKYLRRTHHLSRAESPHSA